MTSVGTLSEWLIFGGLVIGMLAIDLFVFNREAHKIRLKEALGWSIVWIALALGFNGYVWWVNGSQPAVEFLTAYLVEKSLSVDNLFVFLAIFRYFKIHSQYQHRVLFWGVLMAIIMRAVFIGAGTALLYYFDWLMYVFGAFLIWTGVKLAIQKESDLDPSKSFAMRVSVKYLKTTHTLDGSKFFTKENGVRLATPLFLVLMVINVADIMFAVDSVPAVLAITRDPFIVYSSNIFAILGLRALYFLLADVMERLRYLGLGLAVVLVFIGIKMILAEWVHISPTLSLGIIAAILTVTIVASVIASAKDGKKPAHSMED